LDTKDLKAAIKRRSHFPLPTAEDVTSCLTNVKVFGVLAAKSGFWHYQGTD